MNDDTLRPPAGASVWDREMYAYLSNHARIEGEMLDGYLQAAARTESKALAYVIGLLVEDERRHHRQFSELAASLKAEAELRGEEPVVPRLDFRSADRDAILELTRGLLANEENDALELKRLRKDLRDVEDTTLWALLVDTMQIDTAKHIAILKFVERHAKARHS